MNIPAVTVGVLVVGVVIRTLANGSGSVDGHALMRDEEPLAYWSIVVAGTGIAAFLLYIGLVR